MNCKCSTSLITHYQHSITSTHVQVKRLFKSTKEKFVKRVKGEKDKGGAGEQEKRKEGDYV